MYMNGAVIGMAVIRHQHRLILLVLLRALIVCIVAVAGTSMRGSVEYRFATTTIPTTETNTAASDWCVKSKSSV